MQDFIAAKAIMASFFTEAMFLDVLQQAPALLLRTGVAFEDADRRVRLALRELLQRRAVECHPDGTLALRRERYPTALRDDVCRPLDELNFREVGSGLFKPLSEFPPDLQQLFGKAIESKGLRAHTVDGELTVPDGVYLPFLDEHCREPFAPLHLFVDHPIACDVADGSVTPVIRWGVPMISWGNYIPYSSSGADAEDWNDLEVRASLGLS